MGASILIVLGIALAAAIVVMLVSGTAQEITLAASPQEEKADHHH